MMSLQEVVRAIALNFNKPTKLNVLNSILAVDGHSNNHNGPVSEPVRIIHKDQESISAFCLNNVNQGLIALSTPREVQEMDISLLLEAPHWMEDECELDILNLNKDSDLIPTSNFLVIQAASDKYVLCFIFAQIRFIFIYLNLQESFESSTTCCHKLWSTI